MGILAKVKAWTESRRAKPLSQWFFVTFDEEIIRIEAKPQGRIPWTSSFPWSSIERVCFKDEGPWSSDSLYLFTALRPESFVIPIEANGGGAFFDALRERGYFPPEISIKAARSIDGAFYCWPDPSAPTGSATRTPATTPTD